MVQKWAATGRRKWAENGSLPAEDHRSSGQESGISAHNDTTKRNNSKLNVAFGLLAARLHLTAASIYSLLKLLVLALNAKSQRHSSSKNKHYSFLLNVIKMFRP